MTEQFVQYLTTPIRPLCVMATTDAVTAVTFVDELAENSVNSVTEQASAELNAYFSGDLQEFSVNLAPRGTAYQQAVWAKLLTIPFGDTWSYLQLAKALGQPTGSRAVGMANSQNPIAIMIPCHRVIGSNGKLTGYAGGLETKASLLAHENPQRGLL